ncbi:extracellular solute-binding protein [Acidicapsa acidisoli]|uniref:extracellular solute-binding protein n=1 Tax=Acidicapsa acidisoli TaxID=1615681 RepID=UPI0021E02C2E|nr:extracellular solute-binding protein [Acidicapsa acidisoli]
MGLTIDMWKASGPRSTKAAGAVCTFLFSLILFGQRPVSKEPAAVTFVDPEWSHDLTDHTVVADDRLKDFTQETGISVKHLPTPETTLDQLDLVRKLLSQGSSTPDVSGVDVIWPGVLSDELMDLKPYLATELSSINADVAASYTVKGKLVAVPYHSDIGVLFYRRDLLRRYGYSAPPRTWDELEQMAVKIQNGERARGQKNFWGFIWPGAAGEGLTCNALEWQISEGGGRVIETDGRISVNNPDAIRSWQRAAHWIGWISPPSVTSLQEWDAIEDFYHRDTAAFFRGWARTYLLSVRDIPSIRDKIGITSIPAGKNAQAATLGGFGLGISRSSRHSAEALQLIRFLIHREIEIEEARADYESRNWPELYDPTAILRARPGSVDTGKHQVSGVVARPSTVAGEKYEEVSRAYIQAVRSVLLGQSKAPEAAASLEQQLVQITDLKPGPPSRNRIPKDKSPGKVSGSRPAGGSTGASPHQYLD